MSDHGCIPIKLYIPKPMGGQICPGGHSLPTQVKIIKEMTLIIPAKVSVIGP